MQTEIKQVTQHQVILSFANEDEARSFLADPAPAQKVVRAQLATLHGSGASDAIGMPIKKRKPHKTAMGGAKRDARPLERSGSASQPYQKFPCPATGCEQYIAKSQMKNHLCKKHEYSEVDARQVVEALGT